ncbi:MAG: hypothetical protein Q9164_004793 [Protoblastenia rupestris]
MASVKRARRRWTVICMVRGNPMTHSYFVMWIKSILDRLFQVFDGDYTYYNSIICTSHDPVKFHLLCPGTPLYKAPDIAYLPFVSQKRSFQENCLAYRSLRLLHLSSFPYADPTYLIDVPTQDVLHTAPSTTMLFERAGAHFGDAALDEKMLFNRVEAWSIGGVSDGRAWKAWALVE